MVRVSTNGTLRTYRSNLARVTLRQAQAINTVLNDGRRFSSFSESPSLATQSYRAHTALSRNEAQRSTSATVLSKFNQAFASLQTVSDIYSQKVIGDVEQAQNGTNDMVLPTLGQTLLGHADAMVQSLNAKIGEKYIFGGSDADEPPFKLEGSKLYFRGLDVSNPANQEELKKMVDEATYVDIGLGFALDENEKVIPSTAFNSAISGLKLMGFGTTDVEVNGKKQSVPNNMISIIAELGELYSSQDGKTIPDGADKERAQALFTNLTESFKTFNTDRAEVETRVQFLKTNDKRLSDVNFSLNEEVDGLDKTDMADALTAFVYAQYSYNAALRVGNEILSESFLDYMR